MNECVFRKLETKDYDSFLPLIKQFRETYFTQSDFEMQLNNILKSSEIWIVEYENKIIATGTIIYEYKFIFNLTKLAHIEDVCVDVNYRNRGIGKKLINFLIDKAKDAKCYKISLNCNETNEEFYKKCGLETRGLQMCKFL